jgi:SAM-dependent methyltransferase
MRVVDQLLRATARAESRHFWFRGFRWFVAPLVRTAVASCPDARILDAGCGTGRNLEWLQRHGTVYGLDISEVGLSIAREAHHGRLVRASVTAPPLRNECFDLVTSFDVLYSLENADERAAMAELYRLTKPGGFVLINVAAMDILRGDHSVLSHEVRRYSRPSLRLLVTGAGFEVVRLTYTNVSLFLPLLLLRAFQRRRGLSDESEAQREIAVPPAPVNGVLSAMLFVESLWLRWFDECAGSSLLCLARKPDAPRSGRS